MRLDKIKRLIDSHEVVSFDIFDTLLLRPYLRPTDLFVHLEKLNQLPDFATRRRNAERTARNRMSKLCISFLGCANNIFEKVSLFENVFLRLYGAEETIRN